MTNGRAPSQRRAGCGNRDLIDLKEWLDLGQRLAIAGPGKFGEIVEALRKIVDAQETIATYDWQLLFGRRPSKRYRA
jgi:hypothetical protein